MTVHACLRLLESEEQRVFNRYVMHLETAASTTETGGFSALMRDLSRAGFLIETEAPLQVGSDICLKLSEDNAVQATVVWAEGRLSGCRFAEVISKAALSAARLKSAHSQAPLGEVAEGGDVSAKLPVARKMLAILLLATGSWAVLIALAMLIRR